MHGDVHPQLCPESTSASPRSFLASQPASQSTNHSLSLKHITSTILHHHKSHTQTKIPQTFQHSDTAINSVILLPTTQLLLDTTANGTRICKVLAYCAFLVEDAADLLGCSTDLGRCLLDMIVFVKL